MSLCVAVGSDKTAEGSTLKIPRVVEYLQYHGGEDPSIEVTADIYVSNPKHNSCALSCHFIHRGNLSFKNFSRDAYDENNHWTRVFRELYGGKLGQLDITDDNIVIRPGNRDCEEYTFGNAGGVPFTPNTPDDTVYDSDGPYIPYTHYETAGISPGKSEVIRLNGFIRGQSYDVLDEWKDGTFSVYGGQRLIDRITNDDAISCLDCASASVYRARISDFQNRYLYPPRHYHMIVDLGIEDGVDWDVEKGDLIVEPITSDLSLGTRKKIVDERPVAWYWSDSIFFETRLGGMQLTVLPA